MHLIRCNNITFWLFPAPSNHNVREIALKMNDFNVKNIVHIVEIDYDRKVFGDNTTFHNMIFEDGGWPSDEILIKWLRLLDYFNENSMNVGIHCKASLGRAPLLIAIGLIYFGSQSEDAVLNIRSIIKNAINSKQLDYLNKNYKQIKKINKSPKPNKCIIL